MSRQLVGKVRMWNCVTCGNAIAAGELFCGLHHPDKIQERSARATEQWDKDPQRKAELSARNTQRNTEMWADESSAFNQLEYRIKLSKRHPSPAYVTFKGIGPVKRRPRKIGEPVITHTCAECDNVIKPGEEFCNNHHPEALAFTQTPEFKEQARVKLAAQRADPNSAINSEEAKLKRTLSTSGHKHHWWRGGHRASGYCAEFTDDKAYMHYIFSLDNYTCQMCGREVTGEPGGTLWNRHHIKDDKNLNAPWDLITLCMQCNTHVLPNMSAEDQLLWQARFIQIIRARDN